MKSVNIIFISVGGYARKIKKHSHARYLSDIAN
jgi:hypothetical protein